MYPREVWLWRDVMVHDATVDRLVSELEGSLQRAGLPVRVGMFAETPDLIGWREGQEFSPLVLEGHRQSALVIILTDGHGLRLAAQSELEKALLTQVLRAFGEWPRLTFVDVGDGKYGLAKYVQTYGLRCISPQAIPSFLAAGPVSNFASHRRVAELFGDLHAWAAATALSPEPVVAEESAFVLRQHLGLDLSPWQFRDLLKESEGVGDQLSWSPARKAELLNWLTQCSTENGEVVEESLLARALEYWIEKYHEEHKQRQEHETILLPWKQTLAEQRLRMEIALLDLWWQPEKATEELYRLYDNLQEEIRERLALLGDWSSRQANHEDKPSNRDDKVYLPWKESELSARTRWMLAQMGFGARTEHEANELRMPPKLLLALGVSTGLALVALSTAIWRLMAPATPVFQPALPDQFQTVIIRDVQRSGLNDYHVALGTAKNLHAESEPVPARSIIDVQWKWQSQPNIETLGKSELWHAGTLPQAIRGCENDWPRRSLFVLQAEPSNLSARQLAIQLLDRGSADLVLLGMDWAGHLDKLIQVDASLTKRDQLILVLPLGAAAPKVDFQGAFAVVRSTDPNGLIARLDFPGGGVRPLNEVWENTTPMMGTSLVRGGPAQQRDENTGVTFVIVCGGTFFMGSDEDKGSDKDKATQSYADETPQHSVTLSSFEIGKTEITNAQYRQFQKDHEGDDALPAANVSWNDAKAFCENYGYALPSEAEWEYAARGGSVTPWSFAGDEQQLGNYAWFSGNSGGQAHDVGTKLPNPLGLKDMHGNVWEWVTDCYDDKAYDGRPEMIVDPVVTSNVVSSCQYRVLRGGAWSNDPWYLRSAGRDWVGPGGRGEDVGFRCVRRPRRQP
jgi:formylglycine-generating enzyme required for sulfatase activity